ncbi:MAG: hypothetical protein ACYCQK_02100 [Acidiferrobacteraceae bacterium]
MSDDPDDLVITYTVRDLLASIKTEQATAFARLEAKLEGKADKSDLVRMEARLDQHARDLDKVRSDTAEIQQWRHDRDNAADVHRQRDQRFSRRTKTIWAVLTTLLIVAATFLGPSAHIF